MKQLAIPMIACVGALAGCGAPMADFSYAPHGYESFARNNLAFTAQEEPLTTAPPTAHRDDFNPASRPSDGPGTPTSQPASQPASRPASRPAYTAPSPAFQRAALAAVLAPFEAAPELAGAGKEVSESVSLSAQGPIGRTGLAAPSTAIGTSVVSRPALVGGQVVGLGSASPTNNILRAGPNALSGPNGRCAELAGAGFFGGNPAMCVANFRGGRPTQRR